MVAGFVLHADHGLLPEGHTLFDIVAFNGALVLSTALVWWRVLAVTEKRGPWTAFAVGLSFWTLGFLAYDAFIAGRDPVPYPSVADYLWIAFYPPIWVGLILLLRVRVRRLPRAFWSQSVIALLGLAALVDALLFERLIKSTGGDVPTLVTSLAYPIGDVIALGLVFTIFAVTGGRPGTGPALVLVAFAIELPADIVYLLQTASGTYRDGTVLDTAWPIATLLIAHAAWQPRPRKRPAELGRALLVVPITFAVASVGLLLYGNFTDLHATAVVLATITLLASVLNVAVTASSSARLRALAQRDSLTGLLNHGAFHSAFAHELADATADDHNATAVLFDLDGFKLVNDSHGHAAGDDVLRHAAQVLRDACRRQDHAARLGGDEFALLLADCPIGTAESIAQRVQIAVAAMGEGVGVSYGIAEFPTDGTTDVEILAEADRRLYANKRSRVGDPPLGLTAVG